MSFRLSPAPVLAPFALLATAGCATYGGDYSSPAYYEVACNAPGAFRAELAPAEASDGGGKVPEGQATPPGEAAPATEATPPGEAAPESDLSSPAAGRESICLARADVLPRGYRGSAYRYYDNYWWPYRGFGGLGIHVGSGHRRGSHHGGGHRGHGGAGHQGGGHHSSGHHGGRHH